MPRLKDVLIYVAGVKHVAGDMFESVPKGDAIFLKVNFEFFFLAFFPDLKDNLSLCPRKILKLICNMEIGNLTPLPNDVRKH